MKPRPWQLGLALLLIAASVALIFSPLAVATVFARPHGTAPERINLRATFGGSLLGLGLFVAWVRALRPWLRTVLGLVLCFMVGVGFARSIGFVLDGSPDTRQWIWLGAEVVIATVAALALRRHPAR